MKNLVRNLALMLVFAFLGLNQFSTNVRTVQVIGLFACGAVVGVCLANIIAAVRKKESTE